MPWPGSAGATSGVGPGAPASLSSAAIASVTGRPSVTNSSINAWGQVGARIGRGGARIAWGGCQAEAGHAPGALAHRPAPPKKPAGCTMRAGQADVAEQAYALDSKSSDRKVMRVQLPPSAPLLRLSTRPTNSRVRADRKSTRLNS